jgi:hypothetical protein
VRDDRQPEHHLTVRNLLLILLALAAQPAVCAAQQAAPEIPAPIRQSGVTVTFSGYLVPSARGELTFPLPLLERVSADGALLSLDTTPVEGRVVLAVRFGFDSVAEFQRWYADARTVALIRDIRAATLPISFETLLSYRPAPRP